MVKLIAGVLGIAVALALIYTWGKKFGGENNEQQQPRQLVDTSSDYTALATFAGGCFWCNEGGFESLDGVGDVIAGFAGGTEPDPTYRDVAGGQTDYREAVQVPYDPQQITYTELLDELFLQIDPTDAGGQFVDRGFQYTTAIFYHTPEQKTTAEQYIAKLQASDRYEGEEIVTKILPYTTFYPAEEYHQDFYKKSKQRYDSYKKGSGRLEYSARLEEQIAKQREPNPKTSTGENLAADPNATCSFDPSQGLAGLSKEELKERLSEMQYYVTQEGGTERAFQNEYRDNKEDGIYVDLITGEPLFSSLDKYDSGSGWPSFTKPIDPDMITELRDTSLGMERTEIRSSNSDAHLGHVFNDGPEEAGGMRYCTNSASLKFITVEQLEEEGYGEYVGLFE